MNTVSTMINDILDTITDKETFLHYVSSYFNSIELDDLSNLDYQLLYDKAASLRCKNRFEKMFDEFNQRDLETYPDKPVFVVCKNGNYHVHAQLLADYIADTEHYLFVCPRDGGDTKIFWYERGVYRRVSDTIVRTKIRDIISEYRRDLVTTKVIDDTFKLLSLANKGHYLSSGERLNANENIINFENGILHLDTMTLDAHSPDYLSTVQIPCKWVLKEHELPNFDKFISYLARGEEEARMTLIEMIGFCVSNIKAEKFKKSLFLIGQGNCGKTQYIKLIARLIGADNYVSMPFQKLEKRFQIAKIYGKRLAADDDCRYASASESTIFKSMTGGGLLDGEEKGKQPFTFTYNGLYAVAANDIPLFGGDKGDHVYERIIPIQCGDSIPEAKRDKELLEKLYSEREGIVVAAVLALSEAIKRGYRFTVGKNSEELLERYKITNDTTLQFIEECCVDVTDVKTALSTAQMWQAFCQWCKLNNEYIPKRRTFTKSIADKYHTDEYRIIKASCGKRYYPFTLSEEYKEELHCYDGIE